jgi:hypothetical protein
VQHEHLVDDEYLHDEEDEAMYGSVTAERRSCIPHIINHHTYINQVRTNQWVCIIVHMCKGANVHWLERKQVKRNPESDKSSVVRDARILKAKPTVTIFCIEKTSPLTFESTVFKHKLRWKNRWWRHDGTIR